MDKVFGSSGELPLPVPFRLLSVSNPFSEVWDFRVSDLPGPWRMIVLGWLGQNPHVIDTRNGKNHTPSLLTSRRPHCKGGNITGSAHLKRSAKTPALGQYACCFLARNPDAFLTQTGRSAHWGKDIRDIPSSSQCKMILLESNSPPVIKMGGLKAQTQKRICLFNTSYPGVSKRILLNWLQHYERCRNGSLQKIYSLFH